MRGMTMEGLEIYEMQTELHSAQNKKYVIHVEEIF